MIGQKGIPARYGGVETHVEQISTRLAALGHDVSVYCRERLRPRSHEVTEESGFERSRNGLRYRGVALKFRPSINTKHFDAATHTMLCATESALRKFDIVHFHGIGPSAFVPIPKIAGRTVISTVHALDWRQVKWGRFAKQRLLKGEERAVRGSDGVIVVSQILQRYVQERYGVSARYIPNGATLAEPRPPVGIRRFGLDGGDYVLAVGRIIRDRGLHVLIDAFNSLEGATKLVIVGSEAPATDYSDELRRLAGERVIFTGDLYGTLLEELYSNCRLYVLASEVEGLPITVCEAMGYAKCTLLSDIPENLEVAGDVGIFFKTNDVNSLRSKLKVLLDDAGECAARGKAGRQRVADHYNWDRLAVDVEAYYHEVLGRAG